MGKLQMVRRTKPTQLPGRSDGQTKATLGRESIACTVSQRLTPVSRWSRSPTGGAHIG